MIDLALSIAATTGIAVTLRLARQYGRNIEIVIATNYVVAATIGLLLAFSTGQLASVEPITVTLAIVGGLIWPASFHLYAWGIATFGVARTGAWARLSLAIPVFVGLAFFGEPLTVRLGIGLTFLFGAFLLLTPGTAPANGRTPSSGSAPTVLLYAAALIIVFGIIDAWISLFHEVGGGEDLAFFVILFATAALVATISAVLRGNAFARPDSLAGVALGVLNFGVSYFLLRALAGGFENRSAVAFTLFSASSLVLMAVIGKLVWNEQVQGREIAGVTAAILAITALNL